MQLIAGGFAFNVRKELARTAYSRQAVGMVIILLGSTRVSRGLNLMIETTTAQQLSRQALSRHI